MWKANVPVFGEKGKNVLAATNLWRNLPGSRPAHKSVDKGWGKKGVMGLP